jgi:hypothetical protein
VKLKKWLNATEVIQAGSETLLCEIHKVVNSIWNMEELPNQWEEINCSTSLHKGQ